MTPERILRSVALWLPLGFVALCLLAQTAALPFLPGPIVSRWSFAGEPAEWRPAWEALIMTGIIGIAATVPFYFGAVHAAKRHAHRVFAALTWLILMLSLPILTVIVVGQVWTSALHLGQVLLAALVSAATCALAAATQIPRFPAAAQAPDPEQWSRATPADRLALHATISITMNVLMGSVAVIAAAFGAVWWILSGTTLIAALSSAQLITIARIDARGVAVRSPLGFPRTTISLADIESAEVVRIDPLADLGRIGWNRRIGSPQEGVGIRRGEGLRIRRRNGVDFLLATDDAARAAQMLGAQLAAERRA